jgi:hypothetical protein
MTYISIGYNCNPRLYMKYSLKITKSNGYNTCPFDLCITPFESLYKCIETDFLYFFDDLKLITGENAKGDRSFCGPGGLNITNSYGMTFNHEGSTHSHLFQEGRNDDDFYHRNNFQKFRERYEKRIQNFKNYLKSEKDITFVFHSYTDEQINRLKKLLIIRYTNDFNFIRV